MSDTTQDWKVALIGLGVPVCGVLIAWIKSKYTQGRKPKQGDEDPEVTETSRKQTYVERLEERNVFLTNKLDQVRDQADKLVLELRFKYEQALEKERLSTDTWKHKFFDERVRVAQYEAVEHLSRMLPQAFAEFDYASMVTDSADPLVILDVGSRIMSISKKAASLFGYTRTELAGKESETLFPGVDLVSEERFRQVTSVIGRTKINERIILEVNVTPLKQNPGGRSLFSVSLKKQKALPSATDIN